MSNASLLRAHRLETMLQGAGSVRLFPRGSFQERRDAFRRRYQTRAILAQVNTRAAMEAESTDHRHGALTLFVLLLTGFALTVLFALCAAPAAASTLAVALNVLWAWAQLRRQKDPAQVPKAESR